MRWHQIRKWGLIVSEYGIAQILIQTLTALTGIIIIRAMSKPEFALFAIVSSMQSTCNLLAEFGIGLGLRSVGGKVWADRFRFGQLMKTALGLRHRFALGSFGVCLPVTWWMLRQNGAEPFYATVLCLAMGFSVLPLLNASVWGTSLGLHGEYRRMQKLDAGISVLRLSLIGVSALIWINAVLATVTSVIGNWIQAFTVRRWAAEKADPAAPPNEADRREMLSLSLSSLPNGVFFCFQGQITLVILTLVGNQTGIANIVALGRIAVLFAVIAVTFGNVLAPRFSRCQDSARLPRLYFLLVSGMVLVLVPLAALAIFLPGPFLWLLGGKYASLGSECAWVVAASCIGQLGGVMWNLNSSKAWIRVQSIGFIPIVLASQVLAAVCLDLRVFHDILVFNLVTAAAPIPLYLADALLGLRESKKCK